MIYSCWQKTVFPFQLSLVSFLALLILSSSLLADSINCEDFEVPEWREICKAHDGYYGRIYVHESIPEDGLNAEVDSWSGSRSGLHIIPPQRYVLDRKIKLNPEQSLLPNPSTPLSSEKANRTIELSASNNFSIGSDRYFTLIELSSRVSAGGVEIQGEDISNSVSGYQSATENKYPRVLLYAPDSIEVVVAGFVLAGAIGIDELIWNPFLDDFFLDKNGDIGDAPGIRFLRNHLSVNGSATGLLVTGGLHPPLVENNSVLLSSTHTDGAKTVGIRVEKGAATLKQNDIVFQDDNPAEKELRTGIEIDATEAVVIQANAFYAYEAASDLDRGVWVSSNSKWVSLGNNTFSPLIRKWLFEGAGHKGAHVIENHNYLNVADDSYRFSDATQFLGYPGNLGALPVASAYLVNNFRNSSLFVQQSTLESDSILPVYDLMSRADYFPPCPYRLNFAEAIGFPVFFVIGISSNILLCGLGCWSCGARRCPWSAR
ncbi:MAG: hypothetical protein ACR2PT_24440 [Endozoicomonas sp.]